MDVIVWPLVENRENEVYIFYGGETDIIARKFRDNDSIYMLPLSAIEEYHFRFPEQSFEILKYIDQKQS